MMLDYFNLPCQEFLGFVSDDQTVMSLLQSMKHKENGLGSLVFSVWQHFSGGVHY